jgi:hypothetical protein
MPEVENFPMKKKLKWIVLGVLALIVVAVVIVLMNLNGIVRRTVETQSTAQLKLPTTLGGASLSILGGDVSLRDYNVGSPAGYKAPAMLSLGGLDVNTSWSGLRSEPLTVDAITIDKPTLVLEMAGTEFNVKKFVDGLPATDQESAPAGQEPMKLIIGRLDVRGATVIFRPDVGALSALPGGVADKIKAEYMLTIPDITMNQIGTAEGNQNGAAVKEVVTQLITELTSKAAQSNDLPPELRALLSGDLGNMLATLKAKGMAEARARLTKATDDLKAKLAGEVDPKLLDALKNPDAAKGAARDAAKDAAGKAVGDFLGGLKKDATTKPKE